MESGYKKVIVEVDSKFVYNALNNPVIEVNDYSTLVRSIKEMSEPEWEVVV